MINMKNKRYQYCSNRLQNHMADENTKMETGKMHVYGDADSESRKSSAINQKHIESMRAGRREGEPVGFVMP